MSRLSILGFCLSLSSCFNMPVVSTGKVSVLDSSPRLASTVSTTDTKVISSFDPNSRVATTIAAPSGALAGSSVTFPAGSLAIAADLVVEESVPLSQTSVASSLGLSSDLAITPIGSGLIIRPTANVDLTKPLTIAMPLDPNSTGLAAWIRRSFLQNSGKYYTVFYKYFLDGELKAGAIATNSLRFSDDGTVLFEGYFGAYWLAEVSSPILEKLEVKTAEPIVNRDNVMVIASTGVVTEEAIVAKASIPLVEWASISLSLDKASRALSISASVKGGQSLSACVVDLFEKVEGGSGINLQAGSKLSLSYSIVKKEAHNLVGRFRCIDKEARLTISPWSAAIAVPGAAVVEPKPSVGYCSSSQTAIDLLVGDGVNFKVMKSLQALGSCRYSVDIDSLGSFGFLMQTTDKTVSCGGTVAAATVGSQTLSCRPAPEKVQSIQLPQGNYTFTLDFSSGEASPILTMELQPCSQGDVYIAYSEAQPNINAGMGLAQPSGNKMQHLGGCQFMATVAGYQSSWGYLQILNANGIPLCGDGRTLKEGIPRKISCGAGASFFMQHQNNYSDMGSKYLLNLGSNLNILGQATQDSYLFFESLDTCSSNLYLLGPTAAGNSRVLGVNSFVKTGDCFSNMSWLSGTTSYGPFYIGVGEGDQKCGMSSGTTSSSVNLDCTPAAVPIDLSTFMVGYPGFSIMVNKDYATGQPYSLYSNGFTPSCSYSFSFVPGSAVGFASNTSPECLYEYIWTPTAGEKGFAIINANYPNFRCGNYGTTLNPIANGPSTPATCLENYSLDEDFPWFPSGLIEGQSYKVTFDVRLGIDAARISVSEIKP